MVGVSRLWVTVQMLTIHGKQEYKWLNGKMVVSWSQIRDCDGYCQKKTIKIFVQDGRVSSNFRVKAELQQAQCEPLLTDPGFAHRTLSTNFFPPNFTLKCTEHQADLITLGLVGGNLQVLIPTNLTDDVKFSY